MNLEEIQDMWAVDCKVDITEPSKEMARIPLLHSKYSREANNHFLKAKSLNVKRAQLHQFKKDYYGGLLNNPEDLAKHNLEPFQQNLSDIKINRLLEKDIELLELTLKIDTHMQVAKYCEGIIKQISERTYQMKGIIDWEKYIGSQNR
jgi:hypothetical protein